LYFTFRPNSDVVLEEYLEYVLNSNTFHQQMARYVKEGGRAHGGINVSVNDYLSVEVPLPTLLEQRRVVDLVSSVDSYIAALQQQADAARVARNAVLSELLSAGRDDWTETTLGDVAEYVNGYPFKPEHLGEVGTPVIRIRQLLDPTEPVDRTSIDVPDKCVLRDGDIVFSWSGTLAVRIWTRGEAFLNQHLFRILPGPKVDKALLPLLIEHAIEDLIEKSHGTTMKHITKQSLLPHEILLPPLQDQRRIVDLVSSIDDVVQSTERAVADAKSLRSGLLSAVLSGDHEIPESYDRLLGAA
jgi:type I restriction enzyme S subunit